MKKEKEKKGKGKAAKVEMSNEGVSNEGKVQVVKDEDCDHGLVPDVEMGTVETEMEKQ